MIAASAVQFDEELFYRITTIGRYQAGLPKRFLSRGSTA